MKPSTKPARGGFWWGAPAALLALALNLLSPPGFMVTARAGGPAIVLCSGHGPAMAGGTDMPMHKGGKPGHDGGACAFAGHGLTSTPPVLAALVQAAFTPAIVSERAVPDLAPGRGLAAPPPPSQGPPISV